MIMLRIVKTIAVAAVLAAPMAASAQTPNDVSDLVGMRASSLDGELDRRGYSFIKKVGIAQFWWNRNTKACISAAVDNGRVSDIQGTDAGDCGHSGDKHHQASGTDVSDLVGMRASSLDGELERRGYSYIKKIGIAQFWWNRNTKSCISAAVDNGRVTDIQATDQADCGHSGDKHHQANITLVPGAPAAAQRACAARGDEIWVIPAGSTAPVSVYDYGQGNYEVKVAAGKRRANCSVNAQGEISDFLPQ